MTTPAPDPLPTLSDAQTLAWLKTHGRAAKRLVTGAVLCGAAQALVMIALMAALAQGLTAAVMARSLEGVPAGVLALIPVLIVLRAALGLARESLGLRAGQSARQALRERLLDAARDGGPLWSSHMATGALSSVVTDQVDAVNGYFARYLPQQRLAALVPVMILLAVLPFSWMAALILLGTAPLIPFFMMLVGLGTRSEQTRQMQAMQRLGGTFLDLVRGLPTLRLFDARERSLQDMDHLGEAFRLRTMRVLRLAFLSGTVLEFFTSVAIALTAVFLGFSLLQYLNFGFYGGAANLYTALFILLLAPEFYQPLRELGTHYHARAEAIAAALSLREVLGLTGSDATTDTAPTPVGHVRLQDPGPARLDFDGVGLAYRSGVPVLSGCTLSLAPGECVALQGESGQGKSSLLRLAAAIVAPTAGQVRVDGQDIATLDRHAWREQIGWMDQHPPLLAGSLADNLRAACSAATDADLRQALDFAGLGDWAQALPQQLDTLLGEAGRPLSGGQLRRLALARLALRRPRLLLLDEPTASLDAQAESFVIERLKQLAQGCTTLIVSHRPAPLALAQRVLRLHGGQLLAVEDHHV
ncbi:thiol reductant ABC exporter subunit CydD [Amphibiibacter pelophylacis]|uniref:Thiol reductant ABC exporter subunit CydD n=1 Tax=Amphibiibacter pelophylacis TaxID=1799477 RepID=A0ACC6P528_9BURK